MKAGHIECTDNMELWRSSDPLDAHEASVSGACGRVLAVHSNIMRFWLHEYPDEIMRDELADPEPPSVYMCVLAAWSDDGRWQAMVWGYPHSGHRAVSAGARSGPS